MKKGFTLSEVLITLGVVGVIAAMTLPALIRNINYFQYKTAYKKGYSVMSQALLSMVNDDQFIWGGDFIADNGYNYNNNYGDNFKLLSKYLKTSKTCFDNDADKCWYCNGEAGYYMSSAPNYLGCTKSSYAFIDNAGVAYYMYNNNENTFIIDTNGNKAPNQLGRDRFAIYFNKNETNRTVKFKPLSDYKTKQRWCPQGDCYFNSWLFGAK